MKIFKKTLILLFFSLSFLGYAQQFQLTNSEGIPYTDGETISFTITENDLEDGEFITEILVENLTDTEFEVRTYRTNLVLVEGMIAYVCFGVCDDPEQGSAFGMNYPVSEYSRVSYAFHLRTKGKFGFCKFQLDFGIPDESMTLFLEINMTPVGVKEQNNGAAALSAYPNPAPANSTIHVSYSLEDKNGSHRLLIRNIMGAKILSMPLNPYDNTIAFDAAELKSGVYFYTIETNNHVAAAKKLIVK
jgi:hypothetical protein